ncbi:MULTISPECIES: MBL fold metallo-hydrolase [unclassified Microbacterium]|uniref:MBL fold metallo-hydrolase n=1 Tax=unclassified Microbacterium TaxID=2609290 RepID=UPI0003DE3436|nr:MULTISPECIES: MBL fold metallo-hydrolase [unclassified Microbacterium]CDK00362.1 putative Zn-dependent hydrolase of beta-lactamase fold family [Microbacterium sp. C448]
MIRIELTKFGHACVRLEKAGRRILIDPGNYTDLSVALDGAEHILVTHQHPDHLDEAPVLEYLAAHPQVTVRAPEVPAARLIEAAAAAGVDADQIIATGAGEKFEAAGFSVRTVGGQHAVIHSYIPVVANTGYIVDGLVYHPGDSFIVPAGPAPDTLLVPLNAPWNKMAEMVDFITAVRPRQAIPVHDGLLNDLGRPLYSKRARMFAERHGVAFTDLAVGEGVVIEGEESGAADDIADGVFSDDLDVKHFNG